jgi:RNA polymerase sigma factor (sigma-70 family)
MDQRSDEELLPLIGQDAAALEIVYRRNVARVTAFAVRRAADPEEAADLVASVFVEAMASAPRFDRRRGAALPWLLGIAAHQHAGTVRRRVREQKAIQRLAGRDLLDRDDYQRLRERIDAARVAPRLRDALRALPPGEREMVDLVAIEGLTPQEAAEALGLRPVSARMRLSRGRVKLRRALDGDGPEGNRAPTDLTVNALRAEEAGR